MAKIQLYLCLDREAVVKTPEGQINSVWIPEGYYGPGDRDAGLVTAYEIGDEVRAGIATGSKILAFRDCECPACAGQVSERASR